MQRDVHQSAGLRDDEDEIPEPANLRLLRRLVTVLMGTMIVGISVIAGALVYGIVGEREPKGLAFSEVRIEPGLSVISVDQSEPSRIVVVLRDADGSERLRVYTVEAGNAPEVRVVD